MIHIYYIHSALFRLLYCIIKRLTLYFYLFKYFFSSQIACLLNREMDLPIEKIVMYVSKLQLDDGSFTGDKWGEVDTRYSFCALACLSLLVIIF